MAPPKCFFKRPEDFYSNKLTVNNGLLNIKPSIDVLNNNNYHHDEGRKRMITSNGDSADFPLDLSCNKMFPDNSAFVQTINKMLFNNNKQDHNIFSNFNIKLENLLYQLPKNFHSHFQQQSSPIEPLQNQPKLFISPPHGSIADVNLNYSPNQQIVDQNRLPVDHLFSDTRQYTSSDTSNSVGDSIPDNISETSSYTNQSKSLHGKRRIDGKLVRPFKLYRGNDSKSLLEAVGITADDEIWLRDVVQNKSVDDIFQFLSDVMNDVGTIVSDLSDEILTKIRLKFGHIFQNCNSTISNPRMVRHPDMTPKELKTDEYWEKRRKNNEAAKRSREARRQKEESLTKHCEQLQTENDQLRREIETVKYQIEEVKRSIR